MKLRAPQLALLFVGLWTLPAAAQPSLTRQLKAIAAAHHGSVALFAENLKTHESVSLTPDTVVQTASTIKLTILYEALQQLRENKVHWDDPIVMTAADKVPGSGILQQFDAPLTLTFKDVLTMMIAMSDNLATNLAIDHLGLDNINRRTASLGLKNTFLYKKVFVPVAPGAQLPADFKQYGLGKTTPKEMAILMTRLATCHLAEPIYPQWDGDRELCKAALRMLNVQYTRTAIPRYLDALPGAKPDSIANKTGALDAVRADVAAISTPNGVIIISAYTWNNKYRAWTVDHEAEVTIARLSRAILARWSPAGLAPWPASMPPQDLTDPSDSVDKPGTT